jgi:hypothetical protein
MALILDGGGGLGDVGVTNFVEYSPATVDPWLTDYAAAPEAPEGSQSTITFGPLTIRPAASKAAPKASGPKVAVKRVGTAGSILDRLLPLMSDAAGVRTIFGLPPAIVYVAGGILSATLLALLYRMLGGGGRRHASNPKRRPTRRRRATS